MASKLEFALWMLVEPKYVKYIADWKRGLVLVPFMQGLSPFGTSLAVYWVRVRVDETMYPFVQFLVHTATKSSHIPRTVLRPPGRLTAPAAPPRPLNLALTAGTRF